MLLATEVTPTVLEQLMHGLVVSSVFFLLALLLMALAWRVIDRITPGDLGDELLGKGRADGRPNLALGVVVAAMYLGLAVIAAAAIH